MLASAQEIASYSAKAAQGGVDPGRTGERLGRSEVVEAALARLPPKAAIGRRFWPVGQKWRRTALADGYVTQFLLDAADQGLPVGEHMKSRAGYRACKNYLRRSTMAVARHSDDAKHYTLAYRAYAGYVLSRLRQAHLGRLREMWERQRDDAKSPLPLVHLAIALQLQGDHRRSAQCPAKSP